MKIFELTAENYFEGVEVISIVDEPAIESYMVAMNKANKIELSELNADKQLLVSAVLIPDKKIRRVSEDGEEYLVYWSAKEIEKLRNMFFERGFGNQITLDHSGRRINAYIVESWIKHSEQDKSLALSLDKNLPIGTWFVGIHVKEKDDFDYIKTNNFKGFSIEGFFSHKQVNLKADMENNKQNDSTSTKGVFDFFANLFKRQSALLGSVIGEKDKLKMSTNQTMKLRNGELVYTDGHGEVFMIDAKNQAVAPKEDGTYDTTTKNQKLRVIGGLGFLVMDAVSYTTSDGKEFIIDEAEMAYDTNGNLLPDDVYQTESKIIVVSGGKATVVDKPVPKKEVEVEAETATAEANVTAEAPAPASPSGENGLSERISKIEDALALLLKDAIETQSIIRKETPATSQVKAGTQTPTNLRTSKGQSEEIKAFISKLNINKNI